MLDYIGDIIGVLIECEFVKDEQFIYEAILKEFTYYNKKYIQSKDNNNILLNIEDKQPQILKNGTETYKIDGLYKTEDKVYKFELQIKSMVKVFWSEVEHSIIYKNNYYMPDDIYVVNTLEAIKQNLFGLDKMLDLIHTHTSTINSSSLISNLTLNEKLLKQLISETFNDKIMSSIRIKINIKNTRDLVCKFLIREDNKLTQKEKNKNFYTLIERFKEIQKKELLDKPLSANIIFEDEYRKVKNHLISLISLDFEWDLYFQILQNIIPDKNLKYLIDETLDLIIEMLKIQDKPIKEQNKLLIEYINKGISVL